MGGVWKEEKAKGDFKRVSFRYLVKERILVLFNIDLNC